jgi:uncharacterized membrane protein
VAETRRDQQKLWLILFQIKGVRARLNSLALQRSLFAAVAFLIGGAALIWGAALYLPPLLFLVVAFLIVMFALTGAIREGRRGLRDLASADRAAAIADHRGILRGRLATVCALADTHKGSPLWPYLVEDAYRLRDEFAPARIEPRWISRWIVAPLAACAIAILIALSGMIPHSIRRPGPMTGVAPGQISADISDLDIRPADPALAPNAEIYADEKTLRKLRNKLAAAQHRVDKNGLSRWMNKARNLAGNLQDDLTGHKSGGAPPMALKLTDKNPDQGNDSASNNPSSQNDSARNNPSQPNNNSGLGGDTGTQPVPPSTSMPGEEADQLAQNKPDVPGEPGSNPADPGLKGLAGSGSGGGEGSIHGAGSDPQGLFGPDSGRTLGTDNFKITIEADASDESNRAGAPGYIPPRIRVPLNPSQYPDEPLERGSVPSADQAAIKRVFQR